MRRKSKGKLPKTVQKALEKKRQDELDVETAIAPFRSGNPTISKPPDVIKAPDKNALPPPTQEEDQESTALIVRPTSAVQVMERIGQSALVGANPDGGSEYWVTLKQEIFGGLQLRINMHEGQLNATMYASTEKIANSLRRQIPALRRHMTRRGFKVQEIDITVRGKKQDEEEAP